MAGEQVGQHACGPFVRQVLGADQIVRPRRAHRGRTGWARRPPGGVRPSSRCRSRRSAGARCGARRPAAGSPADRRPAEPRWRPPQRSPTRSRTRRMTPARARSPRPEPPPGAACGPPRRAGAPARRPDDRRRDRGVRSVIALTRRRPTGVARVLPDPALQSPTRSSSRRFASRSSTTNARSSTTSAVSCPYQGQDEDGSTTSTYQPGEDAVTTPPCITIANA